MKYSWAAYAALVVAQINPRISMPAPGIRNSAGSVRYYNNEPGFPQTKSVPETGGFESFTLAHNPQF